MMRSMLARGAAAALALTLWWPAALRAQSQTAAAPAQQVTPPPEAPSPWLLVPVFSSSPKLGTAGGGLGAYLKMFDPQSRVSLFGLTYQYTSTHSQIGALFARASFGADHHRVVGLLSIGNIKNDYDNYLGTGQPLQTDATAASVVGRYLYRVGGDWFAGVQGNAANYQVAGVTAEDDLILETLGVRGFTSASLGASLMHDSRDNEDKPDQGWFLNINNLAYREALGSSSSYDSYRLDFRIFFKHAGRHVLAVRQLNWISVDAPAAAQASVVLRGYKFGEYLSPYMSSIEVEERLAFGRRWGATLFAGAAQLYGDAPVALSRSTLPTAGAGLHFVVKPEARMIVNVEYAQGVEGNRGVYARLGHSW